MAYLGRGLDRGNYLKLDDIASQFNGSSVTFNLTSGGQVFYPGSSYALLVSLAGVVQEPESAYTIDQNQITFATPPQSTDDYFCVVSGVSIGIGVPSDGTVDSSKLQDNSVTLAKIHPDAITNLKSGNVLGISTIVNGDEIFVGIGTTNPVAKLDVDGDTQLDNLNVTGVSTFSSFVNATDIIKGYKYTAVPYGSTVTLAVTVASKDATHRYNGTGSANGYVIDGIQAPFLTLTPGRTYRFTNDNTGSHPLKFYLEADKTTLYETNVNFQNTYTEITVTDDTPIVLHYQCTAHGYMGNAIQTNANVVNTNYPATIRSTLNVTGISTLGNTVVGGATTELVITGDLRVTGIITTGTGTVTIDGPNNRIGIGTASPRITLDLAEETDAVSLPTGTTAQRPSGTDAYIRKNSTNNALEFYNGTNWVEIITDYFPTGSTTLG